MDSVYQAMSLMDPLFHSIRLLKDPPIYFNALNSTMKVTSMVKYGGRSVPEIIDPVFAKTSQNARFLLSEYERFGLVFTKTRVYKFGHWAPCEQLYIYWLLIGWDPARAATPSLPPLLGSYTRGRYWSTNIDDISLWLPGHNFSSFPFSTKDISEPVPPALTGAAQLRVSGNSSGWYTVYISMDRTPIRANTLAFGLIKTDRLGWGHYIHKELWLFSFRKL